MTRRAAQRAMVAKLRRADASAIEIPEPLAQVLVAAGAAVGDRLGKLTPKDVAGRWVRTKAGKAHASIEASWIVAAPLGARVVRAENYEQAVGRFTAMITDEGIEVDENWQPTLVSRLY